LSCLEITSVNSCIEEALDETPEMNLTSEINDYFCEEKEKDTRKGKLVFSVCVIKQIEIL
jgi:hypothetical protein